MKVTDRDIAAWLRQEPEKGFRQLVSRFSEPIYWHVRRMVVSHADAQDVVQDTFCSYMEHSAGFRNREHEKAWLIRVATNRCMDVHRGRSRHPSVQWEDVDQYCEFPEQSEVLAELMNLPDPLKTVVYLHYIEGYKTAEIAQMLGITLHAVKKRMQRGRERLKLTLGEEEPSSAHV